MSSRQDFGEGALLEWPTLTNHRPGEKNARKKKRKAETRLFIPFLTFLRNTTATLSIIAHDREQLSKIDAKVLVVTGQDPVGGFPGAFVVCEAEQVRRLACPAAARNKTRQPSNLQHKKRVFPFKNENVSIFVKPSVFFVETIKFWFCVHNATHHHTALPAAVAALLEVGFKTAHLLIISSPPPSSGPCAPSARRTSDYWVPLGASCVVYGTWGSCGGRVDPCGSVWIRADPCWVDFAGCCA